MLTRLYAWAGGERDINVNQQSILANHLVKGQTHYVILHRVPDNFRPHPPELIREKLHQLPMLAGEWKITGLANQKWRVAEMTRPDEPAKSMSASELARGIPVNMYLAQTRVFKITPE